MESNNNGFSCKTEIYTFNIVCDMPAILKTYTLLIVGNVQKILKPLTLDLTTSVVSKTCLIGIMWSSLQQHIKRIRSIASCRDLKFHGSVKAVQLNIIRNFFVQSKINRS